MIRDDKDRIEKLCSVLETLMRCMDGRGSSGEYKQAQRDLEEVKQSLRPHGGV